MAVDVTVTELIERPVAAVAAYAGDPTNAPQWYANIRSVEWLTEPPVAIGSQMTFEAAFLGRRLVYTYEIVELIPGSRLVMRTAQGPFPMETTYEWSAEGDARTLMLLRNRGEPSGFGRIAAPALAAAIRKNTSKDLARLKQLLEG
jgi:uncharacterized membrane protein